MYSVGQSGAGPASYSVEGGLVAGSGGAGGQAVGTNGGSGGRAGGGYYGGGGRSGGLDSTGFNGLPGGGGSGYLATGFTSTSITQSALPNNSSRDGEVKISWQLSTEATSIETSPSSATAGEEVTLTAELTCVYGAEGGSVTFAQGGTTLGTASVDPETQRAELAFTPDSAGAMPIDVTYSGRGALCGVQTATFSLQVSAAPSSPEEPELAESGANDVRAAIMLGLGLVLAGAAAWATRSQRPNRH